MSVSNAFSSASKENLPWRLLFYAEVSDRSGQELSANSVGSKDITDWSEALSDAMDEAAGNFTNEMELREHVHHRVVDAILDLYDLNITATAAEFNTRKSGNRSPLDRLYGGVAVEWEWSMSASRREHGAQQALDYLSNLRQHHPSQHAYTAVVCDGHQWGFLRFDPEEENVDLFADPAPSSASKHFTWVKNSPAAARQFLELIGAHKKSPITNKSLTVRFGPDSAVASRLVTVLGQSMAGKLPNDRTDTLYKEWRRALDVVYGDLNRTDSDLALEIQRAYRTPIARPLGELLFVVHTYFALVGRLIAVELLAVASGDLDGAPSNWRGLDSKALLRELRQLENGRLPGDLEISNLFEADLFSWWADQAESNNDLLAAIRDLLKQVAELAFPKIAFGPQKSGDVLRDLYQALVPNKLRKALGEFLTPHWLAEACLSRLSEQGADFLTGRILDPTCGTGTFIVPVLAERLRKLATDRGDQATAEDVQRVLDSVACIDLNPVAVTATRVNFVLALGEYASHGPLTLPVWRADSIIVPEASPIFDPLGPIAGIQHTQLGTSLDKPFAVPRSMSSASHVAALRRLIEENMVAPGSPDSEGADNDDKVTSAKAEFLAGFVAEFGSGAPHDIDGFDLEAESQVALFLFEQIAALSLEGRNGVWARLIENAFAPVFAGTFDIVVGNPPWLTWTKLPQTWRDQSEPIWRRLGLWFVPNEEGDSFSLQSADIATLVFAVALARYARDGAIIGLLTPSALISADPGGRAFRQFHLRPASRDKDAYPDTNVPFRALWVDDWSKVTPFAPDAANKPIFLVTKKAEHQTGETPASVWSRAKGSRMNRSSWRLARLSLVEDRGSFAPIDPKTRTSAWRFQDDNKPLLIEGGSNDYSFGKGLDTRGANGIYFVSVSRPLPAQGTKAASVQIVNNPEEGRNKSIAAQKGTVESKLIYPLLRGRDVQHWKAVPVSYIALPHDPDELDRPLTAAKFAREFPLVLSWFKRHRETLKTRKSPPTRSWNMTGDDWYRVDGPLQHMQTGPIVVVRELSSRPAAALVEERLDFELGGRSVLPLIDHKLMFRAMGSREEALYLIAMINSTPMQDLLESYVNSVAVSPKSMKRLPIPTFSFDQSLMTDLAALASKAQDAALTEQGIEKEMQVEIDELVLKIIDAAEGYAPQPVKELKKRSKKVVESKMTPLF